MIMTHSNLNGKDIVPAADSTELWTSFAMYAPQKSDSALLICNCGVTSLTNQQYHLITATGMTTTQNNLANHFPDVYCMVQRPMQISWMNPNNTWIACPTRHQTILSWTKYKNTNGYRGSVLQMNSSVSSSRPAPEKECITTFTFGWST